MSDLDRSVVYVFRMQNNISGPLRQISSDAGQASQDVNQISADQVALQEEVRRTNVELDNQDIKVIKNITLLTAAKTSVAGLTNSMIGLGLVTGEAAEHMQTFSKVMQLFVGLGQGIQVINSLMGAQLLLQIKNAAVTTFNNILQSPWKVGLVGAALGAAAGVAAGTLISNSSSTTNNTQIIVENTSDQVQTANQMAVFSGGTMTL